MEICLVCGNRTAAKKCACGFDMSKHYDSYRTLGKISTQVVSAYKKRKEYEKKLIDKAVDSAIADYDKKMKAKQASMPAGNTANANNNVSKGTTTPVTQKKPVDDGSAEFKNGITYYMGIGVSKDYTKAHGLFRTAADKGNAGAMNCLGDMYYFGDGVVKNLDTAKEWYTKASIMGNETAMKNLEKRFGTQGQTAPKATTIDKTPAKPVNNQVQQTASRTINGTAHVAANSTTAAPTNNTTNGITERNACDGHFLNGLRHCVGIGTYSKNNSLAVKSFEAASNQGNSLAMVYLGDMYYFGDGVTRNADTAKSWYAKAASLGDELGAYHLEKRMGLGIEKRDGKTFLKKLAGNEQNIKSDYLEESSVKEGYRYYSMAKYDKSNNKDAFAKLALEIFTRQAKFGNTEAMNYLGEIYYLGECVGKNIETAKSWYEKAASRGNYMAKRRLEQWFGSQKNIPEDERLLQEGKTIYLASVPSQFRHDRDVYYKPAFEAFKKAAAYNNAQAMFYLGEMYYFGDGVSKNLDEAKKWYKKASDLGNADAKQNLKKRFGISL